MQRNEANEDGQSLNGRLNNEALPRLKYRMARILMPGEETEKRIWAAPHDGGYLTKSLDGTKWYGFLRPEQITLFSEVGIWGRMLRREPGTTP